MKKALNKLYEYTRAINVVREKLVNTILKKGKTTSKKVLKI